MEYKFCGTRHRPLFVFAPRHRPYDRWPLIYPLRLLSWVRACHAGLGLAECLGMHDDLILVVNRHHTIIALYYSMGGFHLGADIVGDVAVNGLSCFYDLIVVLGQEFVDFLDVPLDSLDIFFFPLSDIRVIVIVIGFTMLFVTGTLPLWSFFLFSV
jgi:hypothetical protein